MSTIYGDDTNNTLSGTGSNDLIYGRDGDDSLSGGAGDDNLYAGAGNDVLDGGEGNDQLDGGEGADSMTGGEGNDTYLVDNIGDLVIELANGGNDTVKASINYTLGANVENLQLIGTSGLVGTGNALANSMKGTIGADTLSGLGGNDSINGGDGNDLILGGAGNDFLIGGAGVDIVSYADATAAVTVSLAVTGNQNTGGSGIDSLSQFENLTGSDFNDVLTGDAGDNRIVGGGGADVMSGGAGNDRYSVDNAGDVVNEGAGAGTDLVNANIDYTLTANVENLSLFNGAVRGTGNDLDNIIVGNQNDNVLDGRGGSDSLYGGAGDDTFVVTGDGVDFVRDFASNETVLIQGGLLTAGLSNGALAANQFEQSNAATTADIRFFQDTYGALWYDADGSGASAAVKIAAFGSADLTHTNIVIDGGLITA
jgi:Ca2+-binding RTX toxin-like protein